MNRETEQAISKNPPKMAGPLIWALQRSGLQLEEMQYAMDMDVRFLAKHHAALLDELPRDLKASVLQQLDHYDIEPMTAADVETMKAADFRRAE